MPTQVVDQRGQWGDATEGSVGPLGVVVGDPDWESREPLVVGAVEPPVGPLGEQGLDEALGLAVWSAAGRAGPLVAGIDRLDRPAEGRAGVGPGVVGQDPLDPDAALGEPDRGIEQGRAALAALSLGTWAT